MNNLGLFYNNSWGVEMDLKLASEWWTKAAEAGSKEAANLSMIGL